MIDLHTHSFLSDGALLPSELIRRAAVKGYRTIAITDHTDASNLEFIVSSLQRACEDANRNWEILALPGVEFTHVPPGCISRLTEEARRLGAKLVLVHGETIAEPVCPGTNRATIEAGADILAHPGLISEEEVRLAAEGEVYLEITAKRGHSLTNGHVAALARRCSARLVLNTDTHAPDDLVTLDYATRVARGAGMPPEEVKEMFQNSKRILARYGLSAPKPEGTK